MKNIMHDKSKSDNTKLERLLMMKRAKYLIGLFFMGTVIEICNIHHIFLPWYVIVLLIIMAVIFIDLLNGRYIFYYERKIKIKDKAYQKEIKDIMSAIYFPHNPKT